ncbi:MAG: prepilin-type N-terminal cleavage/methylation domain-containing protein [Planctomycetota bacterium]
MRTSASNPRLRRRPACFRGLVGFTLVELIVAISITSVMLLLVSRIFNETTKAINIGADTSQIVSNSRILSDQLFQDLSRINRPKANQEKLYGGISNLGEPAGFMVLIQQTNSGLRFPLPTNARQDPEDWLDFQDLNNNGTQDGGEDDWPSIRTDQIGFFTPADAAESLTPGATDRYDTDAVARMQRIWYGHVARANLDGTLPANTEPGQAPAAATDEFDFRNVTDLVLGRQGLLILDDQSLWPNGERVYDATAMSVNSDPNALTAIGGDANAGAFSILERVDELDVRGASGDYDELWKGATDTLFLRDGQNSNRNFSSYFELANDNIVNNDGIYTVGANRAGNTNPAAIVGLRPADPGPPVQPRVGAAFALDLNELPTEAYNRHALSWTFATPGQRLITTQDLNYPFQPEAVGRNHSFFIPYVSDFAVDFAADITDDYALADDPDTLEPENVLLPWWDPRWSTWRAMQVFNNASGPPVYRADAGFVPDQLPDGRPDEYTYIDPVTNDRVVGIKWYSMAEAGAGGGPNPVRITGAAAEIGQPTRLNDPITYWLPRVPSSAQLSGITSSYPEGPYLPMTQQTIGIYHSPTTTPGTGVLNFNYPPFVGWYLGGAQQGLYSADPSDTPPSNVDARAVFVFGHSTDFDLNGPTAGLLPGNGTDELPPGTSPNATPADLGADGFESGSAKWWPYALRIRYRLHDGDATYNSVGEIPSNAAGDEFEPMPGKWFEQIVPVPHHDTHRPELPL